jgi:hypothetical protein
MYWGTSLYVILHDRLYYLQLPPLGGRYGANHNASTHSDVDNNVFLSLHGNHRRKRLETDAVN